MQLHRDVGQAAVAYLQLPELAHPETEQVLYLGSDTSFSFFDQSAVFTA